MSAMDKELCRLEGIAKDSWYGRGVSRRMVEYSFRVMRRHLQPGCTLELGPAEGIMTDLLAPICQQLTLVEGAKTFCEDLRRRFPQARVEHCLIEEFSPAQTYNNIVLGHVLEHVEDPVTTLQKAGSWLRPTGRVLAAVPNSRSLHRQAAVLMGLLVDEQSLNETDVHHGHRRVFSPESFREIFVRAGLSVETFGGYWLKPVSNAQLEQSWTGDMIDAYMQLGERYPEIAAEIYAVAKVTQA